MPQGNEQEGFVDGSDVEDEDAEGNETHHGWVRFYRLRHTRYFIGQPCGAQRLGYMDDTDWCCGRFEQLTFSCVRKPGHGGEHWFVVGDRLPNRWYETVGGNETNDPAWDCEHEDEQHLPRELIGKRRQGAQPCHHAEAHAWKLTIQIRRADPPREICMDRDYLCVRPKGHGGEHYMVDALNFKNRDFCYEPGFGNQTSNQPWKD